VRPADDVAPAGVSIRRAGEIVGVGAATIRSWERRYGLATPHVTPGGHRRYEEADLRRLALMRDEIIRGRRPSEAAAAAERTITRAAGTGGLSDGFVEAVLAMDGFRLRAVLEEAGDHLGLGRAIDDVLMTGMRMVGLMWRTGRCDVGDEHLATQMARSWLVERAHEAGSPTHVRPIVLACGPTSEHTVGLEALGLLLTMRGWPCLYLGARTPVKSLVRAATASEAAGVVVVAQMAVDRRAAVASIRAAAEASAEVFYAGHAFTRASSRRSVPGTYLPESIVEADALIDATLAGAEAGTPARR